MKLETAIAALSAAGEKRAAIPAGKPGDENAWMTELAGDEAAGVFKPAGAERDAEPEPAGRDAPDGRGSDPVAGVFDHEDASKSKDVPKSLAGLALIGPMFSAPAGLTRSDPAASASPAALGNPIDGGAARKGETRLSAAFEMMRNVSRDPTVPDAKAAKPVEKGGGEAAGRAGESGRTILQVAGDLASTDKAGRLSNAGDGGFSVPRLLGDADGPVRQRQTGDAGFSASVIVRKEKANPPQTPIGSKTATMPAPMHAPMDARGSALEAGLTLSEKRADQANNTPALGVGQPAAPATQAGSTQAVLTTAPTAHATPLRSAAQLAPLIAGAGQSERVIQVQLLPKTLGVIEINLRSNGGQMSVEIVTKSEEAERLLRSELQSLHDSLKGNGIKLEGAINLRNDPALVAKQMENGIGESISDADNGEGGDGERTQSELEDRRGEQKNRFDESNKNHLQPKEEYSSIRNGFYM